MPHVPDLRAHDAHDAELIAAHAAGDLDGTRLAEAEALLAGCTGCAELHADLRAIAAALPSVPVRPRTRDYRLTPEQAATLRPAGWRRFLAAFAAPRLSFTAPLGTGLAALGVAALLLAAMPGSVPLLAQRDAATVQVDDPRFHAGGAEAQPSDAARTPGPAAPGGQEVPTGAIDVTGGGGGTGTGDDGDKAARLAAEEEAARVRQADEMLALIGGGLVVVGLGVLGLRWSGRRFA